MTLVAGVYSNASRMALEIPKLVEPAVLAARGIRLDGVLGRESFSRLPAILGEIGVSLAFAPGPSGLPAATGTVQGRVEVSCERCLKAMEVALVQEFRWCFGDLAGESPSAEWDELETAGDSVDLHELIEDELLLAMPPYPKHDQPCGEAVAEPASPLAASLRPSPFAALKVLKQRDGAASTDE